MPIFLSYISFTFTTLFSTIFFFYRPMSITPTVKIAYSGKILQRGQKNMLMWRVLLSITIARTAQNHCCTRNGLESPDWPHANWLAVIETFYKQPVQQEKSTIHFHPCTTTTEYKGAQPVSWIVSMLHTISTNETLSATESSYMLFQGWNGCFLLDAWVL